MCIKSCCVTGHRQISAEKLQYTEQQLREEIVRALTDGYTHFISGFADGADLIFSGIVAEIKNEIKTVTLEAAIPYRNRLKNSGKLFNDLLIKCDAIGVHSEKYNADCYKHRNRFMVNNSGRVIAVYDGRKKGGTLYTLDYAHQLGREVYIISI